MTIIPRPGKRRMRWVVEYRDDRNIRRYKTCYTEEEAKRVQAERVIEPGGDPNMTFRVVAAKWLAVAKATTRPQSHELYERLARLHILPTFAERKIASVKPSDVELLLVSKLEAGFAPKTITLIQGVLFGIFKRAVRDGLIQSNPAEGITREIGVWRKVRATRDKIKALTPEQLEDFRKACRELFPEHELLFRLMVSTGIRIGEALALRWEDVGFDDYTETEDGERAYHIAIRRSLRRDGVLAETKNSWSRTVDVEEELASALRAEYRRFSERNLRAARTLEPWVFPRADGKPQKDTLVREHFIKVVKKAGLPSHFSPHSLRHTFAAVHIREGTKLEYLKEQLGHSTIQMTYDVYGHWLNKSSPAAAKRLHEAIGWKNE